MAAQEQSFPVAQKYQLLTATYNSPANVPFTNTQRLPTPSTSHPKDRTSYLSALRSATAELQETINRELTSRMEEDKAREAGPVNASAGGFKGTAKGVDEGIEEDNYGEEVVDEN